MTFAVLSDLHLPNPKAAVIDRTVAALVALQPRFVVVTGDHINGSSNDGPGVVKKSASWWLTVAAALAPLRTAHIPVLPVAGNHDSYVAAERAGYATTFADLAAWAAPLAITPPPARPALAKPAHEVARAPFTYAVDVAGLHLDLLHIVDDAVDPDVAAWLAADLATPAARTARIRIAVSHVPWVSVHQGRLRRLQRDLGPLLDAGGVELYIAGHEHFVWDEDFALASGRMLRELLVGCTSGFYNYGPSPAEIETARCAPTKYPGKQNALRCAMPHGGGAFVLAPGRKQRLLQHALATFTLVTVGADGGVTAVPMTLDATGAAVPFYLHAEQDRE